MEIWNTIKNFFVETVPDFCKNQWMWIEVALLGAFLLLFIFMCIRHGVIKRRTRKLHDRIDAYDDDVAEIKGQMDTLAAENESLLNEKETFEKHIANAKNEIKAADANTEEARNEVVNIKIKLAETEKLVKEYEEKLSHIDNIVVSKDADMNAKSEEVRLITKERDETILKLEKANQSIETLKEKIEVLKTANAAAARVKAEADATLERVKAELAKVVKENENLRDIEVENKVLVRTLRRLGDYEKPIATPKTTATSQVILEEKTTGEKKTLDEMNRRELFREAKRVGLSDFATWSNDTLRCEIVKKY